MADTPLFTTDRSAKLQNALDELIAFAEDFLYHRKHTSEGLALAVQRAKMAVAEANRAIVTDEAHDGD